MSYFVPIVYQVGLVTKSIYRYCEIIEIVKVSLERLANDVFAT